MRIYAVAAFMLFAFFAEAQEARDAPSFEVASVKPSVPQVQGTGPIRSTGFRESTEGAFVRYSYVTLKWLITRALNIDETAISGPAWLDDQRYDVIAKMPVGTSKSQIPEMLRALIADRFQLVLREHEIQQKGYDITVSKNGLHLTTSAENAPTDAPVTFTAEQVQFVGITLEHLAQMLSKLMDCSVRDRTGVEGRFDLVLRVSMQELGVLRGSSMLPPDSQNNGSDSV